jgi:hypothetical protein
MLPLVIKDQSIWQSSPQIGAANIGFCYAKSRVTSLNVMAGS